MLLTVVSVLSMAPDDEALHMAVGWLVAALRIDHPGWLRTEVDRARVVGLDRIADRLASWGNVNVPTVDALA